VYLGVSIFFSIISILIFILETHSSCQVDLLTGLPMDTLCPPSEHIHSKMEDGAEINHKCCVTSADEIRVNTTKCKINETMVDPSPHPVLLDLDYVCYRYLFPKYHTQIKRLLATGRISSASCKKHEAAVKIN